MLQKQKYNLSISLKKLGPGNKDIWIRLDCSTSLSLFPFYLAGVIVGLNEGISYFCIAVTNT
jgi:hypothetical protein